MSAIFGTRFLYQLTPEHGTGYYLGIAGGCLMMLLLAYPLKKRVRNAPLPLSTKFWFRTHMHLGIIGPVLIAFHSKLNLGSTNSTVAFVFMMTVMVSGIVGRFLYQKVHVSLYGHRRSLDKMMGDLKARINQRIERGLQVPADLIQAWPGTEHAVSYRSISHLRALRRYLRDPDHGPSHYIKQGTDKSVERRGRSEEYLHWLRKVDAQLGQCINLAVYERLFSWWHYLHLPIFFAFVLATVVHILAVHIY